MSYWCDDRSLYLEQRRLDARQQKAAQGIAARQRRDAGGRLDPKGKSPVAESDAPKDQSSSSHSIEVE